MTHVHCLMTHVHSLMTHVHCHAHCLVTHAHHTQGGEVAQQFTAIDFEIDSFREEELLLASLPKFAELNRHLKVVGTWSTGAV